MEGKSKYVFPVLMGGFITFFLTGIITYVNVGVPHDFLYRWMKSWSVAWPVAAIIGFFSMPWLRRATESVVGWIERFI